jgi:hypothetical protein
MIACDHVVENGPQWIILSHLVSSWYGKNPPKPSLALLESKMFFVSVST